LLLIVGVIITIIIKYLGIKVPSAYTPAAILTSIAIPLISYFVILGILAVIISAVKRSIRQHWFAVLAWLFFIAGMFDLVVGGYNVFILRPKLERDIASLVESGALDNSRKAVSQRTPVIRTINGKLVDYSIHYDSTKWTRDSDTMGDAEYMFAHIDGDVGAMVIAERIPLPQKTLRATVIENIKAVSSGFELLGEEPVVVTGASGFRLRFRAKIDGVDLTYSGLYCSGKDATIQLITFTGSNLFEQYREDMEDFQRGLIVATP